MPVSAIDVRELAHFPSLELREMQEAPDLGEAQRNEAPLGTRLASATRLRLWEPGGH